MQALKEWARKTLILVAMERPEWEEWWEEFKKYNPVSAQILEEFWRKHRRRPGRLGLPEHEVAAYGEKGIGLFENYYAKRIYELRRDPERAWLFQNRPLQANGQHEGLTK